MSTLETFETAARSSIWNRDGHAWFSPEVIAQRAFDEQSCIRHAAYGQTMDHLDEAGYGACTICGGLTAPNQANVHGMCQARARRNMPTPRLDSYPRCGCANCEPVASR